ncbi:hypothetical protein [Agrobacterium cavarae]|uniref:hypothetical protein n=1 Tax=Agrobacterium cavarae TaxID=2528239 RepID=UPI0028ADBBA2|nr:hypothetical protein [Agrobacterium cavarae]
MAANELDDRWLVQAYRYLYAAHTLLHSKEYRSSPALFTPTLHLTAHGIELLLKANLLLGGMTIAQLKGDLGHDIRALWEHELSGRVRDEAESIAVAVWESAQSNEKYVGDFGVDPKLLLREYLFALSDLHTRTTQYALRYVAEDSMVAPRPFFLTETFFSLSDMHLRRFHSV